jgi:hypothetical protein
MNLTPWRYMAHKPENIVPRTLRRIALARGLMVHEGVR